MSIDCYDHQLQPVDNQVDWHKQRSFLYGDGHFTTIKVINQSAQFIDCHLERLKLANHRFKMADLDWQRLQQIISLSAKKQGDGYLRVHISRGAGGRGYGGTLNLTPFVFVTAGDWQAGDGDQNLCLSVAATPLHPNSMLAGLKHNNRLEQVLIATELESAGLKDALVCDTTGNLIETNKANVFWRNYDGWHTPCLSQCGVEGVIRGLILKHNPQVQVGHYPIEKVLAESQSMLICNALTLIKPVAMVADKAQDVTLIQELNFNFL